MNTANILTSGCKVETEVSFASPTTRQCIFGAENTSPYNRNYLMKTSSGFDFGAYDYNDVRYSVSSDQALSIDCSTIKGEVYLKVDTNTLISNTNNQDRTSQSLYLFAFNNRGRGANQHASMRLYYFKLYNSNNELIRDLIPVKRKSDNVICMYDRVTETFYTNAGTGVFTAGPETPEIPDYTELYYIQSTGTQFINTGIRLTNEMSFELTMKDNNSDNWKVYLGDASTNVQIQKEPSTIYCMWGDGSNRGTGAKNINVSSKVTFKQLKNKLYVNGALNTTFGSMTFTSPYDLYISNLANNQINQSKMYIYSFKVWDDNGDIMNLIPVKRNSDDVICMYDTISRQYFENAGTGSFVAGSTAISYTELEYIQSTGTQYIDTGVVPTGNTLIELKLLEPSGTVINYERLFGAQSNQFDILRDGTSTTFILRVGNGSRGSVTINPDIIYTLSAGQGKLTLDGTTISTYSNTPSTSNTTQIFHCGDRYGSFRLYYAKIYNGNDLIRDFIPVKDPEDVVCLLDKVSGNYFYNAGTGMFTAGGEV